MGPLVVPSAATVKVAPGFCFRISRLSLSELSVLVSTSTAWFSPPSCRNGLPFTPVAVLGGSNTMLAVE